MGLACILPPEIAAQIEALDVSHVDPVQQLEAVKASRRDLLRTLYSSAQLQERMSWFWLNHFSVFEGKAELRWLVGDYEETAIRPNVFGRLNENYARELMELHILGVDGGYSQQDVENLAQVLTGVGVRVGDPPRLKPALRALYYRRGAFEFNPARHDFDPKTLLGQPIMGKGFAEVDAAVTLLVKTPACAHFISRKLAVHFVADTPPPALVDRMAQTFLRTDGDIAAVLRTMLLSHEVTAAGRSATRVP